MSRTKLGLMFKDKLKIYSLFLLMAYIAYAIGINLEEFVFVRPDALLPMPNFLNFANSLWDPYQQSGFFSILEPQYQSFYPLAYFLKFMANTFTFNLFFLLNIALAGFCLFCYLREINLNVYASILGGMTFMLSGFIAGHKMHTIMVSAAAWVPLILVFLERSFKDESQRSLQLIYGAFAFSLVVLAGYSPMVLYGAIAVSGYALFRISFGSAFKEKTALDKLFLFFKSLVLIFIPGFAVGSIAIVPVFESFPLLNRNYLSFENFSSPGWQLDALPMVLFPFFYGNLELPTALYPSPYFGPVSLWEISWFIGALPFSLFLYTFYIRKELPEVRTWMACFFLGVCLVGGDESPLYGFLGKNAPFFSPYFRVGRDILLGWFASSNLFRLAVILLVGSAVCTLLLWLKWNPRHQFVFGVLATLFVVSLGSPLLYRLLYHIPIVNLFRAPVRHLFEVNLAMSILSAIGFNHLIENRSEPKAALASRLKKLSVVMALLGFSFVAYYYLAILPGIKKITPSFPTVDLHLIIPITAIVITIFVLNVARFWTSKYFLAALLVLVFLDLFSFSRFHYYQGTIDPRWDCLKIKRLEDNYSNFRVSIGDDREGICGLLGIQGNHAIWFNHYMTMVDFKSPSSNIRDNPRLLENSNMLRLLSVKYLSDKKELLKHNLVSPAFELIEEKDEKALYVNKRVLPRIRFVKRLQRINDFSEAKRIVYSANFDPENVALLTDVRDKTLDKGEIIESQFENDSIRIKANTGEGAFLVFSDSWHPGWQVFVDSKPATLAKPYAFQMGVSIFGQGEHLIEFRFEPTTGYLVGKWISLITLSLMICFVLYRHRPAVLGSKY